MLENSDRSIPQTIEAIAKFGIEASFLVPTETGLSKSILDAHRSLRLFLKNNNLHDYELQSQGSQSKKNIEGFYVTEQGTSPTQISLYRPETKNGDPRIWPYKLKQIANSNNLLAIFSSEGRVFIANVSNPSIMSDDYKPQNYFLKFLENLLKKREETALELLDKIKFCTQGDWIKSKRKGPTGVGFTLETLLGISENNSQSPDYKGIELKAGRLNHKMPRSRTTLFSKIPDWSKSACSSGMLLLENYGYLVDGRRQLYCSLNNKPNTLGHFLKVTNEDSSLHSMHINLDDEKCCNVFHWDIEVLTSALSKKHRETFWVKAQVRKNGDLEEFRYSSVTHTKSPLITNVVEVLKTGGIELDYCLHEEISANGQLRARDHGYLFKIWPQNLNLIFPPATTYQLF